MYGSLYEDGLEYNTQHCLEGTQKVCSCTLNSRRVLISQTWVGGGVNAKHVSDREMETHRGSVMASVKAKVSKNRSAAIQMENTTSKQHQWQLHLPAAVFHMLMLVLVPANATQCTRQCACACARCLRVFIPQRARRAGVLSHMALAISVIWQNAETHAHVHK